MAEATVDETSLVGIFGRECPSPARDRLTTVPTAAISARASVQRFELEQQFALGAVQGERENEVRHETLALPGGHGRGSGAALLRDDGREQTINLSATSNSHFTRVLLKAPLEDVMLKPPAITRKIRGSEAQPMPIKHRARTPNRLIHKGAAGWTGQCKIRCRNLPKLRIT